MFYGDVSDLDTSDELQPKGKGRKVAVGTSFVKVNPVGSGKNQLAFKPSVSRLTV